MTPISMPGPNIRPNLCGRVGSIKSTARIWRKRSNLWANLKSAALQASYRMIALHLLKMLIQPQKRSDAWEETIIREQANIKDDIATFPGLKPKCDELFAKAYPQARALAAKETHLPLKNFPVEPPFTRTQAEDEDFSPPGAASLRGA